MSRGGVEIGPPLLSQLLVRVLLVSFKTLEALIPLIPVQEHKYAFLVISVQTFAMQHF